MEINKEALTEYYSNHSNRFTCEHFNISNNRLLKYLEEYDIPPHNRITNIKLSNLQLYGVENVSSSKSVIDKIAKTKAERYGSASYNNREKAAQTCLEKYGTASALSSEEVRAKISKSIKEHYGVDNIFRDISYMQDKYTDKYGSIDSFIRHRSERIHESVKEKYGVDNVSQIEGSRKKALYAAKQTLQNLYGVDYAVQLPQCRFSNGNSSNSKPNQAFKQLLEDNKIDYSQEFVIDNYSYDFKVGNNLIEIDPFATHNANWSPFGEKWIHSKTYHHDKSQVASNHEYRCIHVFDWDNPEKIIALLRDRGRIFARKCSVVEILDKKLVNEYLNNHHLQGTAKFTIAIGLYYKDKLVSVMTFDKPRYNKRYQYELVRYCSHYDVIGGVEKLFSYFVRIYNPYSIISYCDLSKFNGNTYTKLGFEFKSVSIGKHWYNPKTHAHITDNLLRQRGYDQLFKTNYGKGTSNEELMRANGFVEIYDAGQASYIWT